MFCSNCGTKNDEGIRFCKNCGTLLNFVPGQNVPHNYKPYSPKGNPQQMSPVERNPFEDPFADELPEEKPVKLAPDPFSETVPMLDGFESHEEKNSLWGFRLPLVLMILSMIIVALVNVNSYTNGFSDLESLYKDCGKFSRLDGSSVAYTVCKMVYYHGMFLFGLIGLIGYLVNSNRRTVLLVFLFLTNIAGIVGVAILGRHGNFVPSIVATVLTFVMFFLNAKLVGKTKKEDSDCIIDSEEIANPLL